MARKLLETILVTLVVVGGLLWLSGCAATPAPAPVVRIVCPSLTVYTKAEQKDLSSEMKAHPELVATDRFIQDYSALRSQVRSCRSH